MSAHLLLVGRESRFGGKRKSFALNCFLTGLGKDLIFKNHQNNTDQNVNSVFLWLASSPHSL